MWGISTILITRDEEKDIERCLKSVRPFSDEIIVVDSGSTDRTVEIARAHDARVIEHEWLGYGPQKQLALEEAAQPWVFSIDADEVVTPALCQEIQTVARDCDGYEVARRVWYMGRWIRHSGWYPRYVIRLFRRDRGSFTGDAVHESVRIRGRTRRLREDLLHYSYRDVDDHMERINDFTTLAATQMFGRGRRSGLIRMVVTPWLQFHKVYILRRGFLDGFAGLVIALLHSMYVFLKHAKLRELCQDSASARTPKGAA
ncbi:MAG: glycosyltransferase family 2 protein [Candidatus Krumholzibacteriota bacterium]|nr:glycosyltransferase family 2 protein [Candidatus Krumholzibacteriota bacterium]